MQFKCSVKRRPVLLETDDSWGETMQISTFFKLSNLNKENIFQSGLISLIVGSDEILELAWTLKMASENNS